MDCGEEGDDVDPTDVGNCDVYALEFLDLFGCHFVFPVGFIFLE